MSMYGKYPKIKVGTKWVEQKARPQVDCSIEPSMAIQSDKDYADINKIMARVEKGAMIDNLNKGTPFYGDVSQFSGLQNAIEKVQEANNLFSDMDPKIREKFDNDPVKMVNFLQDVNNRKEAEELGMVIPQPKTEPVNEPEPVDPSPSAPPAQ